MPDSTFRTRSVGPVSELGSDALVVHCSDPRYQPHFQQFLQTCAGLPRYTLVAVPGGPHFLTLAEYLPKFSWVGWRWAKFVMDVGRPARVILIAHDDCRWYLDQRFAHLHGQMHERQLDDLRKVQADLRERFGPLDIEIWFARLDGHEVTFDRVG